MNAQYPDDSTPEQVYEDFLNESAVQPPCVCVCTYRENCQAHQFANEFAEKFGVETEIRCENDCFSVYAYAIFTESMLEFTHNEFRLLPENTF